MTYFEFLGYFLALPLTLLTLLTWWDGRQGRHLSVRLRSWPAHFVIVAHVLLAVLYTTPWDNYLVASGVWWYEPRLVSGLVLGWAPIEEYIFFVGQTLAMGLWVVWLAKRVALPPQPITPTPPHFRSRLSAAIGVALLWLGSLVVLFSGWAPGTYLLLILSWALCPVILQMGLGADILWRYRVLLFWALVPATLYLGVADGVAISAGTWTIDPTQSTGIRLGQLPLEEGVFFLMTNLLVVFGTVLVLAAETQARAPAALKDFLRRLTGRPAREGLLHV